MSVVVVATITPLPDTTSRRVTRCAPPSPPSTPRRLRAVRAQRSVRPLRHGRAWSSADALAAHGKERPSPNSTRRSTGWWRAGRGVVLDAVPAGDPAKGLVGHG